MTTILIIFIISGLIVFFSLIFFADIFSLRLLFFILIFVFITILVYIGQNNVIQEKMQEQNNKEMIQSPKPSQINFKGATMSLQDAIEQGYRPNVDYIKEYGPATPGTCRICGCSIDNPCYNPNYGFCSWIDKDKTLCSHCANSDIRYSEKTEHCVRTNNTDK